MQTAERGQGGLLETATLSVRSNRAGRRSGTATDQVLVRDRRQDDAQERDDELRLAEQWHGLLRRAILQRDEQVLALTGDEREGLSGRHLRVAAERDDRADDELQGGEEKLVMPFGRRRDESVKLCAGAKAAGSALKLRRWK